MLTRNCTFLRVQRNFRDAYFLETNGNRKPSCPGNVLGLRGIDQSGFDRGGKGKGKNSRPKSRHTLFK